ncbi:MAG: hypothetical protein D8M58_20190 [Calditrichaeota bacterium]|nr:MAG: hypothetical protein DWQ03_14175 [Calditrichota bacterium]MBL1207731.1 hypothetical protein [Calditrichota bacterium]NOG47565.1 hypothetical protein [Calditrichota bacterium]
MHKGILLFCIFLVGGTALAQDGEFGVKFSGFVKFDAFFDTRQVVAAREGHFHLYPAITSDANDNPSFNMLAIQTRLKTSISAPDAFGAKVKGVVEGAFFGHSAADVNGFRLRHAFATFDWDNTQMLFGQYWHPMFVTAVFPGTVSFNTGVPFQPFSRNPQIRLTQKVSDNVKLIAAAMSQRDFASSGGSKSLRDAVVPNLHAQIQLTSGKHVFGGGVDYKSLRPSLSSDETVTGISFLGYAKLVTDAVTIKAEGVLGQNMTDLLMLGGYAFDADSSSYVSTNNLSVWTDIHTHGDFQVGVFAGYTANNGADEDTKAGTAKMRGSNIASVLRVSPRAVWNSGKARFAVELEYTAAAYGTANSKLEVENTEDADNIRLLFSTFLFFN